MAFVAHKNTELHISALRQKRDSLLAATDWCMIQDAPLDLGEQLAVGQYREALRDCTKIHDGRLAALPPLDQFGMPEKVLAGLRPLYGEVQ